MRDAEAARYDGLIQGALEGSVPRVVATCEPRGTLRVERGAAYALLLLPEEGWPEWTGDEIEDLLVVSPARLAKGVRFEDAEGHRRPVYEPMLFYAAFQAFKLPGAWETDCFTVWADALEARLAETKWPEDTSRVARAADGAQWVEAIWWALAGHAAEGVIGVRTDLAPSAFGRLAAWQTPSGTFLEAGRSDNPETHWYHELLLLHAAASYAAQTADPAVEAAVARAAVFHLNETQPDHATNQPWGLAAFLRSPETRPLADQMLHAAATVGRSGVTSILLADALYCLRLWMGESV